MVIVFKNRSAEFRRPASVVLSFMLKRLSRSKSSAFQLTGPAAHLAQSLKINKKIGLNLTLGDLLEPIKEPIKNNSITFSQIESYLSEIADSLQLYHDCSFRDPVPQHIKRLITFNPESSIFVKFKFSIAAQRFGWPLGKIEALLTILHRRKLILNIESIQQFYYVVRDTESSMKTTKTFEQPIDKILLE
ncbi:MAG: hypothetical protein HQ564_00500 [Candidatus Saganbacteria bacterium]|nr:hypothetical protein [Candidatus Saganbacteria bacterium]